MPILFLHGVSGSGKSQVIALAKYLHDVREIQGPDCTFVSLRNEIYRQYWVDQESEFIRDGAMLLFDNAWERTFLQDDKLLSMLLRSYERSNATLTTSSQTFGENKTYITFSGKIISSVSLFESPKLQEIHRRLYVIRLKKMQDIEVEPDFEPIDKDSVSWDGLYHEYFAFWNNEQNCKRYVISRQFLTDGRHKTKKKVLKAFPCFDDSRYKVSIDVIATMVATGGYSSEWDAIEALAKFFDLQDSELNIGSQSTDLIKEYLDSQIEALRISGNPEIVNARSLKAYISKSVEIGVLPEDLKRDRNLRELMGQLGYSLTKQGWVKS